MSNKMKKFLANLHSVFFDRAEKNEKQRRKISTKAGVAAGAGTAGYFAGLMASLSGPAANLGGYAVAQTVASSAGIGIGGAALSGAICTIGGPIVAGVAVVAGVGLLAKKIFSIFD